jgi:hypothetical protein
MRAKRPSVLAAIRHQPMPLLNALSIVARMRTSTTVMAILILSGLGPGASLADQSQPPEVSKSPDEGSKSQDLEELAKATQNPVADLISVPLQNNLDYEIGPFDRARNTLNIQPVLPLKVTDNWNVVARIITPIIYQPDTTQATDGTSGLGDINPTFFVAPSHPGAVIWGVGPTFLLPTATQQALGTGKWSVGPAAVVLVQPKPWTIGALANNVWSFAGEDDRSDVNQFLLQYFVNLNLPGAWYLTSSPILTANWEAASGDEWIVPFGAGVGKIFLLGKQALNGQVSAYWNAVTPDTDSPSWQLRIQLAFLFPTKGK